MSTFPRHNHADDTSELLSGYLDGALDVVERRRTDQLLADCAGCAAELADLRTLRTLLRELPAPLPRRSFTLDPNTVRPRTRLFPIFRIATFAAALLLVVVLGVDALVPTTQMAPAQSAALTTQGDTAAEDSRYALQAAPTIDPAAESARAALAEATAAADTTSPKLTIPVPAVAPMPQPTGVAGATAGESGAGATGAAAAASPTDASLAADAPETMQQADPTPTPATLEDEPSALTLTTEEPPVAGGAAGSSTSGGGAPSEPLANSEPAGEDTTDLDSERAAAASPGAVRPLRLLAYVLGALTLALGGATWWAARRRI